MKHSQETEYRNTDDGAKKSISKGQSQWEKNVLKSGEQSEIPQPYAAEEKRSETGAEILMKTQKDTGVWRFRCEVFEIQKNWSHFEQ